MKLNIDNFILMKKTGKDNLSDILGPSPDPKKSHKIHFLIHRSEQPLRKLQKAYKADMTFKFNEE